MSNANLLEILDAARELALEQAAANADTFDGDTATAKLGRTIQDVLSKPTSVDWLLRGYVERRTITFKTSGMTSLFHSVNVLYDLLKQSLKEHQAQGLHTK